MKRALKFLPLVSIIALAFVLACGGEQAPPAAPEPAAPAAPEPAAPEPAAPAAPEPAAPEPTSPTPALPQPAMPEPATVGEAPQSKNPSGTFVHGRSIVQCNPGIGTVYCDQYRADAWGAGEDLFTWRWKDDGTIDYEVPQLAVGYELAPDALSVVIETRQGVQFHKDAGEMTAEDVAWSYNRVNPLLTPHSIAPSASYFSTLFGENPATVLDENHVEYKFASLDTHWSTYMMNTNGFVGLVVHSKDVFDENGEEWARDNFIGTGPFEVDVWTRNERAVLSRFEDHWGIDTDVEQVTIQEMPEEATRIAALQTGELDSAELGIKSLPPLLEQGFETTSSGNASQSGIIFSGNLWEAEHALTGEDLNTSASGVYMREIPWIGNPFSPNDGDNPAELACPEGITHAEIVQIGNGCGDMEQARLVRQAVGYAIDRETINEQLLDGLGWPVHIGYADEKSPHWNTEWEFTYDPELAEEYLDRAGYPRGSDGVRFQMPLYVSTGSYAGVGEEIMDAVSGMMAQVGIQSEVLKYPYPVFRPGLVGRSATVPRLTAGDDGQTVYPFDWPKGIEESSLSRGGYCICYEAPEISRIYKAVGAEPDLQKRIELNKQYFEYQDYWALKPGVVAIPALTIYNPNSIQEWVMEPTVFGTSAFWNIVPGN